MKPSPASCPDGWSADARHPFGALGSDVVKLVTADTTAIAIPERLVIDKLIQRIAVYSGLPVIVTPSRAA